jgi:hypothetical protein
MKTSFLADKLCYETLSKWSNAFVPSFYPTCRKNVRKSPEVRHWPSDYLT